MHHRRCEVVHIARLKPLWVRVAGEDLCLVQIPAELMILSWHIATVNEHIRNLNKAWWGIIKNPLILYLSCSLSHSLFSHACMPLCSKTLLCDFMKYEANRRDTPTSTCSAAQWQVPLTLHEFESTLKMLILYLWQTVLTVPNAETIIWKHVDLGWLNMVCVMSYGSRV